MIRLLLVIVILSYSYGSFAQAPYLQKEIEAFEAKYNVGIVTDSLDAVARRIARPDSVYWSRKVQVRTLGNTFYPQRRDTVIYQLLKFLDKEFSKYPKDYFKRTDLRAIALPEKIYTGKYDIRAVPNWRARTLVIEASYRMLYNEPYLANVIHHEFYHYSEHTLTEARKYFKRWKKANPKKFEYGYSGYMQYDPKYRNVDFGSHSRPKEGFISYYSMTGDEEDRAVIVSLMMNDRERDDLLKWLPNDEKLLKKVELAIEMLNAISGTEENYWSDVIKGTYD